MLKVVCIPAYNVENMIYDVVTRSKKVVDMVVVCDDGSIDDTVKQASNAGAVVISHEKNLGKGAALKSLFNYCIKINADIVVTIDGDGQFLPEEIPKFSQLSISLPNYDLFLSPNGTIITATPLSDTSFLIYVFFPNIERRWFWFSKCRLIK